MATATLGGNRSINMAMNHPDAVDLWEDGSGGLHITTPGCEYALTNLELKQDDATFEQDAANLPGWREDWTNQDGNEVWSVPMDRFQEDVENGGMSLVATWIPANDGSYPYANESPELWLRSSPGRAAEKYLGIDGEDFWSAEYPVWVK